MGILLEETTTVEVDPNLKGVVEADCNVTVDPSAEVTTTTTCTIIPENSSTDVEVVKNEYSIVGDGLYASINAEAAPQWLVDIIDSVVDTAVTAGMVNYDLLVQDVQNAIDALDVAANTYVEQITFDAQVNAIISTRLTTLNATLGTTYATITGLETAVANADFALTQAISDLTSAYTAEINSQISTVQTAYTNADTAIASDVTALTASFVDQETNLTATADALTALQTYVGVDAAGASTFTNLSAYLETPEGVIGGATSKVTNGVYVNGAGDPESQFEYVSTLSKNGNYYTAGFGLHLTETSGSGTELDPYSSEFWINAEKFKFTNTAQSGIASPFSIDASGATPQVTFDGIVDFTNTNMTAYDNSNVDFGGNNDEFAQQLGYTDYAQLVTAATGGNTIINGGYINTNLLVVDTAQITDLAVTSAKIEDLAVTNAKIGNLAVDTANIADAAIETAKIGDLQVETLKIGYNAVTLPLSSKLVSDVSISYSGVYTDVHNFGAVNLYGQDSIINQQSCFSFNHNSNGLVTLEVSVQVVQGATVLATVTRSLYTGTNLGTPVRLLLDEPILFTPSASSEVLKLRAYGKLVTTTGTALTSGAIKATDNYQHSASKNFVFGSYCLVNGYRR